MERIDRVELYMGVAHLLAQRSTCERGQVGVVIVKDDRIISTGYNGAPPGMPHCLDVGCDVEMVDKSIYPEAPLMVERGGCRRAIHAEANAIAFAANHGVSVQGGVMYCTHSPCLACAQLILSAGIMAYHYEKEYRVTAGKELLDKGLVPVRQIV